MKEEGLRAENLTRDHALGVLSGPPPYVALAIDGVLRFSTSEASESIGASPGTYAGEVCVWHYSRCPRSHFSSLVRSTAANLDQIKLVSHFRSLMRVDR